jgi:hypothetical protein
MPFKKRFRHVQKHLGRLVIRLCYFGEQLETEREAQTEEEEDDANRDNSYKAP